MPPDLRGAMRTFATGVCVASTYRDAAQGRRHDAVTVNSLGSLSLEPPLISLCFRRESVFLGDLLATRKWVVSILPADGGAIARRLATGHAHRAEHVASLAATPGPRTGALVLDSATWLECDLRDHFDLGDHTLVVGEVLATGHNRPRSTLVFVHGRYHALDDPQPATVDLRGPGHWGDAL